MLRERLHLKVPDPQFAVLVAVLIQAVAGGHMSAVSMCLSCSSVKTGPSRQT